MTEPTYVETTWANTPSTTSPIDQDNLNKIEQGVSDAIARATKSIRYDAAQSLNPTQQAIARANQGLGDIATRSATEFNPSAYPSYVGARTKTFDARSSLYNGTAINMRNIRAGINSTRQGGTFVLTAFGDSTTAGSGATSALSWPGQMLSLLLASGCPIKGTGLVMAGQGVTDPRWASTGTITAAGSFAQLAAAATKTFTSDRNGTTAVIRFYRNSGNFSILVDGSAPSSGVVTVVGGTYSAGTVTPDGASSAGSVTVTGLTDTVHAVKVTSTATTYLIGIKVTGTAGLEINNMGVPSSASGDWTSTGFTSNFQIATLETPGVIIIPIGVNDGSTSVPVATYKSNLSTIASNAKAIAPVLLVAQINASGIPSATQQQYVSAMYDVADTLDLPVLDLMHRWGSFFAANLLGLTADSVHPNSRGYADWAQATTSALQLAGGGGSSFPASPSLLGQVPGYDSGIIRWFTTQEHVARALGWTIATDNRWAGGADSTGAAGSSSAINAAVAATSAGGTVWFPPGTFKIDAQVTPTAGIHFAGAGNTTAGANVATLFNVTMTGSSAAINASGVVGFRMSGIYVLSSSGTFTGTLVDLTSTQLSELNQVNLQATTSADLLHLDQCTYHESRKVNFIGGAVQVLGKATNGSYANAVTFTDCRWGGSATAALKNVGEAWAVRGGASEPGASGIANFYRHDSGVLGKNFEIDNLWMGDITATGPNTQIVWGGDNLTIRDSMCGWNDGTLLQVDENNCTGIIIENDRLAAFHTNNPTYAVDFGTTTGHTGFRFRSNKVHTALTQIIKGTVPADSEIDLGTGVMFGQLGPADAPNLLSDNDATIEGGIGNWVAFDLTKNTTSRVTTRGIGADPACGQSITIVTGPQDVRWQQSITGTSAIPVTAGVQYTFAQYVLALDNARTGDLIVDWYTSAGSFLSSSVSSSSAGGAIPAALTTYTKGTAVQTWITVTAPSTAAFARIEVRAYSTVNNDRFLFGRTLIRTGAVRAWHRPGNVLAPRGTAISQAGSNTNGAAVVNSKGTAPVGLNTDPGSGTGGAWWGDGLGNVAGTLNADGTVSAVGLVSPGGPAKTANYNMVAADGIVTMNGTSLTASLPDPTAVRAWRPYIVKNINASAATLNSQGTSKTIDGAASVSLVQWAAYTVVSDGTQWLIV